MNRELNDMKHFEYYYEKVKPIVLKLRCTYFVKLWDYDDWLQEGRIVLFQLLQDHPELLEVEGKLYPYFKTKFSNYVKDVIRHQESVKRQFNQMGYEEISELDYCIAQPAFMQADDFIAYQDSLTALRQTFGAEGVSKLDRMMRGERFKGKSAFLRSIEPFFLDFKE